MDFNKERFFKYAKYDIIVNKPFFRNMSLISILGAMGITTLLFFCRYMMYTTSNTDYSPVGPNDYEYYNYMVMTPVLLLFFIELMQIIFAGCWAHNLRKKQDRLKELTLPASNIEKYLWHTGLTLIGGFLVCLLSIVCADVINFILTALIAPSTEGLHSLTMMFFNIFRLDFSALVGDNQGSLFFMAAQEDHLVLQMLISVFVFGIVAFITTILCFHFGNAVKYKYNVILTYITLYIMEIIAIIILSTVIGYYHEYISDFFDSHFQTHEQIANLISGAFYSLSVVGVLFSILLVMWSYRLFKRAQITSRLNK